MKIGRLPENYITSIQEKKVKNVTKWQSWNLNNEKVTKGKRSPFSTPQN